MPSLFLDHLVRRVIVFDGAMGTALHGHDLDIERDYLGCENCTDLLVRTRPDVVGVIHETFLEAGADAIETDTFGANPLVLGDFDLSNEAFELNRLGAEVARDAAAKHTTPDKPRFVIGSMGPGTKLVTLGNTTWAELLASYTVQASGLLAGGVDAFLIETCQDLLQVKCAVNACLDALKAAGKTTDDVPIMVSVTIETTGTMLLGTSIEAAVSALRRYPIASLGLNCATGPVEMAEHVHHLGKHWDRPVSVIPNAGLPILVEGRTEYPLGAKAFTQSLTRFIDRDGVSIVGGCCGTTPRHIQTLVESINQSDHRSTRPVRTVVAPNPGCTSLYSPADYRQDTSFLIVGERMNASGSRKFKRLLEAEDFDGIVSLAREQVRDGSHVLDLNVDYAGRDNAADMAEVVQRVATQVDAPLMLDSTQAATIEAGLRHAPGKCIINSANFEDGEDKFDAICHLAKTYGAALVIGTIDEDAQAAMARTADRKFAIAKRAIDRATQVHGLAIEDLFIDPLVLPISTGMEEDRRSALALIEGTRRIAEAFPDVQLTCGLSNVSFGLRPAARVVLNSVFLDELVKAGMTSSIVHASKIVPLAKIDERQLRAAQNLIHDRRDTSLGGTGLPDEIASEALDGPFDPLSAFIELFKDVDSAVESKTDLSDRPLDERLRLHIIDGEKEGLSATIDEALATYPPIDIINDHLLDGMKTVGELFGSGQMQLPFVLQSAAVMKQAVAQIEPHMEKEEGQTKGTIVLATVKGDVHDIGKNLVDIILSNNGFTVYNLGIKQPLSNILAAARERHADAIGLSGLLVKSVMVMEDNLNELNEERVTTPILLGGAALTRHYAESHLRDVYEGALYYGKDAFEGLSVMNSIADGATAAIDEQVEARRTKRAAAEQTIAANAKTRSASTGGGDVAVLDRSAVATDVAVPAPPFWGSRVVDSVPLDDIYPFINEIALFRGQWQFKKGAMSDAEYEAMLADTVQPIFARLKDEGKALLTPKVVYGYFPCLSDGDNLIVYDANDQDREIERFTFPRQSGKKWLCISDYFRPISPKDSPVSTAGESDSGEKDVVAFHCVTMGPEVSIAAQKLFKADQYTEYLYLHGLGVEAAEALAELWHKRIRQELGIGGDDSPRIRELFTQKYRGGRYSFGYPACPEMADQEKLFRLLEPQRIGCELTENWQIDPEQSTSALIVHHPEAKYFAL
jgi:5-methyltetrahydrofolate--homocysteine methyltransferase